MDIPRSMGAPISVAALAATLSLSSLASVISGRVVDDRNEPLPATAVQLVSLPDTVRAGYMLAGDDGGFRFDSVNPGRYVLLISMTGMDGVSREISVPDSTSDVALGDIPLTENAVTLNEAVVTAVRAAVVAKQDTLEFNAGSFHTGPNSSVEDLLKKLPGVEVGSDGSITSGGKTVKKILVDGKEFFADDPKVASKNLPSDIVEKVQVVDRKSDAARLTGIDDGDDETVINLTVKKGMNNGWFGDVKAGYGTDGRYEGSFNVSRFVNGNQISIIGGANNINEMGFSDMGRGRFRDFGGNNGINSTRQLGINFNVGNEEKFRVGGNVFYTNTDRRAERRSHTQYLFPDSVSTLSEWSDTRDRGHSVRADFRLQWNIDERNTLEFRPRFSLDFRRSELADTSVLRNGEPDFAKVNANESRRFNRGRSLEASGDLIFNHRFASRKGRSFSVRFEYSFSDTKQRGTTWSDIEYFLRKDDSESLYRYLDGHQWSNYVQGRLTYTEPLGDPEKGHFLNLSYKAGYRWNNADQLTYTLPLPTDPTGFMPPEYSSVPADGTLDESLSNSFRNSFFNQELQIGYKYSKKGANIDAGILVAPSSMRSEDLINPARNVATRWTWNVAPYARLRYKFSDRSSISANYRARTSQPSVSQLQPVADVSDPLNIKVGNPSLRPTFTQSIGAHFNSFDLASQRSLFAVVNASMALNSIVSRTVSDPLTGARTTTYANADGNWNLFGMVMLNQPLRNRSWRFNVRFNGMYSNTPGYIDGDFNRSGSLRLSPSAGLTFSSTVFQMTFNPTYTFGLATNSLPRQLDRKTHSYGFDTDVEVSLPFGLSLSTDLSFSKSTGYSAGFNTSEWLWNAELSYSTLADKSLTFSVRAFDLLGQNRNISRSVSSSIITDSQYNDLTRYVMFGVSWKFNTLKSKPKRRAPGGPDDLPPGPPPGGRGPGSQGGGPGGPGGGHRPPF